jgi:hypothetical protein
LFSITITNTCGNWLPLRLETADGLLAAPLEELIWGVAAGPQAARTMLMVNSGAVNRWNGRARIWSGKCTAQTLEAWMNPT